MSNLVKSLVRCIIIIVIIIIIIRLVSNEIKSQDYFSTECINRVDAIKPDEDERTLGFYELSDRIILMIQNSYTLVGWRRSLILACVVSAVLIYIYNLNIEKYFLCVIIIALVSYTMYQRFQLNVLKPKLWVIEDMIRQHV